MKKLLVNIRDTFIAGLVFLVPLLILVVLVSKVLRLLESFTLKLSGLFTWKHVMGVPLHIVLGLLLLLVVCLLCGYLVRVTFVKQVGEWTDHKLRRLIPGYGLYHNLVLSRLQKEEAAFVYGRPAWLHTIEGLAPGFVMETLPDGRMVVFVPAAGNLREGDIFIVESRKVSVCENKDSRAFRMAIANQGIGLDVFPPPPEQE